MVGRPLLTEHLPVAMGSVITIEQLLVNHSPQMLILPFMLYTKENMREP